MFLKSSNKTALVWKDQQVTYNDLLTNVGRYASLFSGINTAKVAIFSENRLEWVYAFYAAWKNKNIAVPIDFMSTADEVAYILNDCRPEVIFCSFATQQILEEALKSVSHPLTVFRFDDIDMTAASTADTRFPDPEVDRTAVLIYTSGTTGSPKGVMLSYDNLLANIESVSGEVPIFVPGCRVMVLLPLHHIFPLIGSLVAPLAVEGTAAFCPSMASEDIMKTLQDNHITIIIGVPRFYSLLRKGIMEKINKSAITRSIFNLARAVDSLAFSRVLFKTVQQKFGGQLNYMVCGGAKLDPEIGQDFKTLGLVVLEGYGMTEAAPMISFPRPGNVLIGSAGQAMPTLQVETRDGEIVAKGRNIMQGYYNRPEETAQVLKDGWLHTGDLGHIDENGFVHITGRKKEIIVLSNGKNVNPEEVEQKLVAMSDVVAEAGVFMKDDMLQALIFPNLAKIREQQIADIEQMMRADIIDPYNRQVSPYKKIMKFTLLKEELPKTRLGKVKRFLLADLAQDTARKSTTVKEPDFQEYQIIKEFLTKQAERDVLPDDHLEIDLAMDSLDKVGLSSFLNATFGVNIRENELTSFGSVAKLADHVHSTKEKIDVEAVDWGAILREKVHLNLPKSWFTYSLMKNIAKLLLRTYFRLKGEGYENLPDGPFILAPNHQSFFDGLFVASFLKNFQFKKTYFYAKEKHVRKWWVKFIANHHNVIVMDVNRDLKQSLQKMANVLKSGKNIIIFPEGTRTKDGAVGNFKKTFAILSKELNVPVVPVAIKGAFEALPKGSRFPRPWKKITVKFLHPVYPESADYDNLKNQIHEMVVDNLT